MQASKVLPRRGHTETVVFLPTMNCICVQCFCPGKPSSGSDQDFYLELVFTMIFTIKHIVYTNIGKLMKQDLVSQAYKIILSIGNIGNIPKPSSHSLAKVQACCVNFLFFFFLTYDYIEICLSVWNFECLLPMHDFYCIMDTFKI